MKRIRALLTRAWALSRREPALLLQLAGTAITLIGAYLVHLTTDQMGALTGLAAALVGILTWRATSDGLSAMVFGLLKAAVVTALAWHLHISADTQALIYTAASGLLGAWLRTQVTAPVPAAAVTGRDPGVIASASPVDQGAG